MNHVVNVAAVSVNQVPLDWEGNLYRIREALDEARDRGATVICFPELSLTGYGCEDLFLAPEVGGTARQQLEALLPLTRGVIVSVGLPVWLRGSVFNGAALLVDGELAGISLKQNLAGDGLHYEPRWFKPWIQNRVETLEWGDRTFPVGDLVFDVGGLAIGFEICEDAWVADRPGIRLSQRGVDLILNPSASHFAFGKQEIRERFIVEGSRAFACGYVYANLLGNESGRVIFDGGTTIASAGAIIASGKRFSFRDHFMTLAAIDPQPNRTRRAGQFGHDTFPAGDSQGPVEVPFDHGDAVPLGCPPVEATMSKEEEFARAEALALFDYMRKSRSRGFVLSLSGGADSGSIACLVGIMQDLAKAELGSDGLAGKLAYFDREKLPGGSLLTCVYQGTRNSSEVTRDAAATIAEATGAHFLEWSVDDLVEGYTSRVSQGLGRDLTWEDDDISLQNIQARVRAPGVWMLANVTGGLLLATSNRSEAAVGYTTMDGDTCGGLSPICGIDKAFLQSWLRWLEKEGTPEIRKVPELRLINEQDPTAELRPLEENQTDEGDLMPYPVLDSIEKLAIRDRKLPMAVYRALAGQWNSQYSEVQLREWVVRFYRLWCRNQWKRERFAPSFHLDDENLDPRTWCRFPILNSGFEKELAELEDR